MEPDHYRQTGVYTMDGSAFRPALHRTGLNGHDRFSFHYSGMQF
ncbi:hypothetical protein SXCC_01271 [Gluconacetobacter sp. SXCC-1]|nr:hypothetical protein SXCC_01271 [Gluconacetobacter sp. SXCC-1]